MTGIPLTRLEKAEAERLLADGGRAAQDGHQPGRGDQGHRARRCAARARGSRTRAGRWARSSSSGPSGVGKTLPRASSSPSSCSASEDALIQIDMSEYMEKHNASRLVGAPPGLRRLRGGRPAHREGAPAALLGRAARRDREGAPRRLQHAPADHGGGPADRLVRPPRRLPQRDPDHDLATSAPASSRTRPASGFGKTDARTASYDEDEAT